MCSGARSNSANGAIAARAAPASSWSTSSSTVLSDCTIRGPSVILSIIQARRTTPDSAGRHPRWQRDLGHAGGADLACQPRQRFLEDVHRERPVVLTRGRDDRAGDAVRPAQLAQRVGRIGLIPGIARGVLTAKTDRVGTAIAA